MVCNNTLYGFFVHFVKDSHCEYCSCSADDMAHARRNLTNVSEYDIISAGICPQGAVVR